MKAILVLFIAVIGAPSIGLADDAKPNQVIACYAAGASFEEKYSCMGSNVETCPEKNGAGLIECVNAETDVWRSLIAQETAKIEAILKDNLIISGPCMGNQAGCLQGLKNLLSDSTSYADQKCSEEAGPEQNAGMPDLAMALCTMRETARSTIRVHQFGARMGQNSSN